MTATPTAESAPPHLPRRFGLLQATALNMSTMIGIGPFITIPALMAAMGGPQAMLGWVVALVIACADGLVWSELGAAMPGSGGTYIYLRDGFGRERLGRAMAFLFIWQFLLSGPLEIASGYIGFAQYTHYLWPGLSNNGTRLIMAGVGAFIVVLLYRQITAVGRITVSLWVGTLLTTGIVIASGSFHSDFLSVSYQSLTAAMFRAKSVPHFMTLKQFINSVNTSLGRMTVLGRVFWISVAGCLVVSGSLQAQPTITSVTPPDGATGVSATTPAVFVFSTAMNTSATYALFNEDTSGDSVFVTYSWSADGKALTCTPAPSWPANQTIDWAVNGFDISFTPLEGASTGSFTVGGGGGNSGSGTNRITTFTIAKIYFYDQTSTAAPFLDGTVSDGFGAATSLASNRTANAVTLTVPGDGMTNLTQNPFSLETFSFFASGTNNSAFDAAYPSGDYLFDVQASTSNQQVSVTLPSAAAMPQPPAPHVSNFDAAQSVDTDSASISTVME